MGILVDKPRWWPNDKVLCRSSLINTLSPWFPPYLGHLRNKGSFTAVWRFGRVLYFHNAQCNIHQASVVISSHTQGHSGAAHVPEETMLSIS